MSFGHKEDQSSKKGYENKVKPSEQKEKLVPFDSPEFGACHKLEDSVPIFSPKWRVGIQLLSSPIYVPFSYDHSSVKNDQKWL